MWHWQRSKLLLWTWITSAFRQIVYARCVTRAQGAANSHKSDYEQLSFERYPDSANLLPISVETYIFVPVVPNSALLYFEGAIGFKWQNIRM
jgi:hypothetical protein